MTRRMGACGLLLFLAATAAGPAGSAPWPARAEAAIPRAAPAAADTAAEPHAAPLLDTSAESPPDSVETLPDWHGDILLFEAETYLREKNWPEAIRILRGVTAENPARVDAWEALAGACRMALVAAPEPADTLVVEALGAYQAILEQQPRNRQALEGMRALASRFRATDGAAPGRALPPGSTTAGGAPGAPAPVPTTRPPAPADRAILEETLRRNPGDVPALAALARLDLAGGSAGLAEKRLRMAVELGDSSRATGDLLLQLEDSLAAAHPTAERAFYRGRILLARGDGAGAERAFHQALEMDSTGIGYDTWLGMALHYLNRNDDALAHLERALDIDPDDPAARFHAGAILFDRGQYEAAVRQLAPVADEHRFQGEAARLVGLALSRLEDAEEESIFYLERALREGSRDPLIHCVLAEQYLQMSRWKEARAGFRKCLEGRPDYPTVLLGLGLTADQAGDYREAVERLEAFRRVQPATPSVMMRLGISYLKLDEPDSAAARFRSAIEGDSTLARLHPSTLNTRQLLEVAFLILMAGRNIDDGISVGEYLVSLAPADLSYANNLAMAYADADRDLDRALELALMVNEKRPDNTIYLDTLGWTWVRMKRYREARKALEHALELSLKEEPEGVSELYYHLGVLYSRTDEREKAVQALRKSLEDATLPHVEKAARELLQRLEKGEEPADESGPR